MSFSRNVSMSLLGVCVLVSGCSVEGGEPEDVPAVGIDLPDEGISAPSMTLDFPISTNGLSPTDFWVPANQQALRSLGAGALYNAGGALVPTTLLNTLGGQSVLRHALRCALNDGTTVQSASGAFAGELNLAPAWASRALNTSEQRWLTACMLDHLNGLAAEVSIGLVGQHPALVAAPGFDSTDYTINDQTAFGNLFLASPKAYICPDLGLNLVCGLQVSTYTLLRICGLSPTCGATVLLPCSLICSRDAAGNPTCTYPLLLGPTYTEAISTKLEENVALSLYPLCSLH
jgi:hypothetical protein